ncbi:NADPH-dependent FMN reductase [Vibrio ulleungensis]|uniref:NAD(P)H-dependent oxidoreductase n=1 Tax=Vibrio ulleungensis TaxID=2807619 RepID=A0ABS2HIX7_9VIBR|nr:NAD(P)H-dependent oxidoreductase [Vibrio ulleungensis]MBM7036128.1 NAD(P)H-dependent oxidoreductase [Vibrio ulleungensis]
MNILAFGASNSTQSINKTVALYAANQVHNSQITLVDLADYDLPLYSIDRENSHGIPEKAQQLFTMIGRSDAVVISYAEHNGSYTAAYKNVFDWMSRIDQKVFQDKSMVLFATSPGPGGAQNVLASAVQSAPYFGGNVLASLSIPSFFDNFSQGTPVSQKVRDDIQFTMAPLLDVSLA